MLLNVQICTWMVWILWYVGMLVNPYKRTTCVACWVSTHTTTTNPVFLTFIYSIASNYGRQQAKEEATIEWRVFGDSNKIKERTRIENLQNILTAFLKIRNKSGDYKKWLAKELVLDNETYKPFSFVDEILVLFWNGTGNTSAFELRLNSLLSLEANWMHTNGLDVNPTKT